MFGVHDLLTSRQRRRLWRGTSQRLQAADTSRHSRGGGILYHRTHNTNDLFENPGVSGINCPDALNPLGSEGTFANRAEFILVGNLSKEEYKSGLVVTLAAAS